MDDLKVETARDFVAGERVSAALNAARAGAWRLKVREDQVEWEPPLDQVLRESMRAFTGSEESFLSCIHPDDIDMVRDVIQAAKETGGEFECEFRLALHNRGRWMQMRGKSNNDDLANPEVSGIGFEVTQRRNSDFRFEAFYELSTALNRVTDAAEVFESAIDAIMKILSADRASILLFDEDGILRFRAWRNLSTNYRDQVEGHTPWSKETKRPDPITISVVSEETLGPLASTIAEEGIQSLAFVPLCCENGLLGKFMVYFDHPREFTPMEIGVAETIAGHVSYAIERQASDQARARLASIVQNSDDAIISKSLEGKILSWNDAAERIFGYSAEEAVGRHISLIVPEDRLDEENGILARLGAGERIDHFETVRRTKSGRSVLVSITVSPIRDSLGRIVGASKISRDIRDIRRSKEVLEALLRIGARFSSTLDPDILLDMLLEEAGQLVGATSGSAGYFTGDALQASVHYDNGKTERDTFPWMSRSELAEGEPNADEVCCRLLERFGQTEPERSVLTPILDSRGTLLGAFCLIGKGDGSPFEAVDRQLLGAIANAVSPALQNALAYRTQQETEQRLKEADNRKNEFLATLAHELRNPLAPIQTSVNLLQLKKSESHETMVATSVIERQVKQMARLIDDLMDVSRITQGRIQIHREKVQLNAILQESIDNARPLMEKQGHRFTWELGEDMIVDGDPVRLVQIFGNLLNNAAKYTEPGGEVHLRTRRDGDTVSVEVRDTGIGIPPGNLPNIFEMFAQETPALSRSQGGLGIGLWLVQRLAELHGGSIRAYSAGPGKGSTFTLSLPTA